MSQAPHPKTEQVLDMAMRFFTLKEISLTLGMGSATIISILNNRCIKREYITMEERMHLAERRKTIKP